VIADGDGAPLVHLGRPVGSSVGVDVATYAAVLLGIDGVRTRYDPATLELHVPSTPVVRDLRDLRIGTGDADDADADGDGRADAFRRYRPAVRDRLTDLPAPDLASPRPDDPTPADALATVGADLAALGSDD
jgi:ribonuclease HI